MGKKWETRGEFIYREKYIKRECGREIGEGEGKRERDGERKRVRERDGERKRRRERDGERKRVRENYKKGKSFLV